jgi:hypothetical protein
MALMAFDTLKCAKQLMLQACPKIRLMCRQK